MKYSMYVFHDIPLVLAPLKKQIHHKRLKLYLLGTWQYQISFFIHTCLCGKYIMGSGNYDGDFGGNQQDLQIDPPQNPLNMPWNFSKPLMSLLNNRYKKCLKAVSVAAFSNIKCCTYECRLFHTLQLLLKSPPPKKKKCITRSMRRIVGWNQLIEAAPAKIVHGEKIVKVNFVN